jgi:hypothetical protein
LAGAPARGNGRPHPARVATTVFVALWRAGGVFAGGLIVASSWQKRGKFATFLGFVNADVGRLLSTSSWCYDTS